jgi:hypothetical protein
LARQSHFETERSSPHIVTAIMSFIFLSLMTMLSFRVIAPQWTAAVFMRRASCACSPAAVTCLDQSTGEVELLDDRSTTLTPLVVTGRSREATPQPGWRYGGSSFAFL